MAVSLGRAPGHQRTAVGSSMGCWECMAGAEPVLSVHQGVGGCLSCVLPTAQLGPVGGAVPVHWDKGFTARGLSALTHAGLKFAPRSQVRAAKASAWQKLQRLCFKGQAALPTQEPAVSQSPAPQPLLSRGYWPPRSVHEQRWGKSLAAELAFSP